MPNQDQHTEFQVRKAGDKGRAFPDRTAHLLFWPVAALGLFLDLWTKKAVFARLGPSDYVDVIPGCLRLLTAENPGAAFSLASGNRFFLIAISIAAVIGIIAFFFFSARQPRLMILSLGLFLAGVCGNLWDRIANHGHVRDFIDAYIGEHHWPTFNVADSLLCIAVGLILLTSICHKHPEKKEAA